MIESRVAVRYPDCDPMGIVHHAVYPLWYEIGRMDFFSGIGYPYLVMQKDGVNPALVDFSIQYRAPVYFPETVTVRTACTLCQGKKLELKYAVYRDNSAAPASTATTFLVWADAGMNAYSMENKPEVYRRLLGAVERPAVLILAGGRSSRMGRDKAQVAIDGETMLERASAFWKKTLPEAPQYLSAGQKTHTLGGLPELTRIYDLAPDQGPLGGLQAAFRETEEELFWVSAVDMPLLSGEAAALLEKSRCHCEDACVFTREGRPEPLFGIYRRTCLPVIERLLSQGQRKVSALLDAVKTTCVPLPNENWVRNINTPQELRALQAETQP